ncbi:MAG TPA: OPT/YSL family transporter, partial [Edaphobacter sp.]|uniref:OPT/YSL family transporter n=1 Tax=Edaphobacter sp. TaxID=1934404 RepID=UPI002B6AE81C
KRAGKQSTSAKTIRTERDIPMSIVLGGSALLIVLMWAFLQFHPVPGAQVGALANLAAAILVIVFGFLFVTVSARIVGIVGSSASPVSGMTIATLMATAAIFLVRGWTAPAFGALAITIGGIVCIAASNAGDTSQDLKTGFLIGATPWKQQVAIMIGVIVSIFSIGATLNAMNTGLETFQRMQRPIVFSLNALPDGVQNEGPFKRDHLSLTSHNTDNPTREEVPNARQFILLNSIGSSTLADGKYLYNPHTGQIEIQWIQGIGSEKAAAPQGRLMATVINGILTRKLPWGLVLLGVALVICIEMLGIRSLTFAVGAYLSIATTLAIFVGGLMRWMVDRTLERRAATENLSSFAEGGGSASESTPALDSESEISSGSLYASGLIAAGGIVGLMGVGVRLYEAATDKMFPRFSDHNPFYHDWISVIMFALLAFSLFYFARKPLDKK